MDDPFESLKALGPIPPSHAERLRYIREADRSVIATIDLGVLFIMAWWSGPARSSFELLKQTLSRVDPSGRLELVIVDTDGCPDLYVCPDFAGTVGGWGEVAWIREGRVVCTSGLGFHPECFEPNTRAVLAM